MSETNPIEPSNNDAAQQDQATTDGMPAADPLEQTLPADSDIPTLQAPAPVPLAAASVEREDYTLTSADAARINTHLEGDYVKEGETVHAARDADGLFVQVYEARVPLGVE